MDDGLWSRASWTSNANTKNLSRYRWQGTNDREPVGRVGRVMQISKISHDTNVMGGVSNMVSRKCGQIKSNERNWRGHEHHK